MAASSNMNSFNQYDNSVAEFWKRASLSLHSAPGLRLGSGSGSGVATRIDRSLSPQRE